MRTDVVGRHIEITDPIRAYAEQKTEKLTRFFDGVMQITCTITHDAKHPDREHHVELVIDVVKHANFVATAEGSDLYGTIDMAVQKASRQITDFKEQLKPGHHRA